MNRYKDWKDEVSGYYDKAISLAILFMLFTFLVTPKIEVKGFERQASKLSEVIEIPPEIKDIIKPPEEKTQPIVSIVIDDDLDSDMEDELEIVETIATTTLDMMAEVEAPPSDELPDKFAYYDEPPVAMVAPVPDYPEFAKKARMEGTVVLEFVVNADGTVGKVEVLKSLMSGPGGLDEAAIKAIKKTKFQPALANGKPVSVWVTYPITFTLTK